MKLKFQTKLFLYLAIFNTTIFIALGIWQYVNLSEQLYRNSAALSLKEAKYISDIPLLKHGIINRDMQEIKRLLAPLVARSDASFIVIGDAHALHLYHSQSKNLIGTKLVGGDNARVLAGNDETTMSHGTMGISLRSKVPVFYNGQVIGIVSVGYLKSYLHTLSAQSILHTSLSLLLMLCCLYLFSWRFTKHIKKQILFLEP